MGIPAFFRWLVDKFPKVVVDVIEEQSEEIQGVSIPVDTSKANPNKIEFDNLYLDMNGIIHPCCHPHDKPAPPTEEHMLIEIGKYLDRLFAIVRPRKVLYLAIDGVAPRAKMNQQRSRRFRAAREAKQKKEIQEKIDADLLSRGQPVEHKEDGVNTFDSNCITPGTPFMDKIAKYLRYYIVQHISSDPGWRGVKVILSDSNVPGEGEHKIMEYIRQQRSSPNYDPNTRHCIYGLDADLIMLSLATHEPHFSVLREIVTVNNKNTCFRCNQPGHLASECTGEITKQDSPVLFQFLHVNVLREYLNYMLFIPNLPFEFDLERAVDDWVFLCFFVGNDFLPHLPTLEIRENAIGLLTNLYKQLLPSTGYLTKDGEIHSERVEVLLKEVGHLEDSILQNRLARINRAREAKNQQNRYKREREPERDDQSDNSKKNMEAAAALRASIMGIASEGLHSLKKMKSDQPSVSLAKSSEVQNTTEQLPPPVPIDNVRLGEAGWKERYYQNKFHKEMHDAEFFRQLRTEYLRGLAWVLKYYYSGCPSWEWYFPFHYAPFASEMVSLGQISLDFDLGLPFKPLEQLMGVLPAASALHVPEKYRNLMIDPASPIKEFYPIDFEIDLNGKMQEWQGVALLPFIDEKRLRQTLSLLENTLTEEENQRNTTRTDILYVHDHHEIASQLQRVGKDPHLWIELITAGFTGFVAYFMDSVTPGQIFPSPVPDMLSPVGSSRALSVNYKGVKVVATLRGLLQGVLLPLPTLSNEDLEGPRGRPEGYYRNQNSAANRMINNSLGSSNQHKMSHHQQNREHNQRNPYSRPNFTHRHGQDSRPGGYQDQRSQNYRR